MVAEGDSPGRDSSLGPSSEPVVQCGTEVDAEYVRRVYERAIDWYKVAEAKAQLILTVNGVLVTVVFSIFAGNIRDERDLAKVSGVETWFFLLVCTGALLGAVTCAAACLWSQHGKSIRENLLALA